MPHTAHREFSDALQHVDKSVTSGVMGADFLSLGKSEQGHADRAVLRERLADHLSYITVEPEQSAKSYTDGLRQKYSLCLGLSVAYILFYLAAWYVIRAKSNPRR